MSILFTFPPELKVRLFKSFTLYQLLQMRLVSKQWKILMEEVGSFKTELRIVAKYTKENTAFNSVKLSRRRSDDEPPLTSPDGAHFLSTIFPNITKATFDLEWEEYHQPNCFNFDILLQWAPNLTYLNFNMECLHSGPASVNLKCAQLLAIISSLPALTHLHLTDMQDIRLPEPFPVLSRLEELNLYGYDSIEHLAEVLRQVSPSLTSLAVDSLPDVLPESTITKLSSSLTKLTITGLDSPTFWQMNGPILRRLKGITYLDLSDVSNYFVKFPFPDLMAILVDLPQLRTVSLSTDLLSRIIKPPYSFPANPAVRELYIKRDDYEPYEREMRQLSVFAYAFPNVNKVTIATYDVHEVRRFLRIDDRHCQTLKRYVKGHFGEQTEVKLVNIGHWVDHDVDDYDEEEEDDAYEEDDDEDSVFSFGFGSSDEEDETDSDEEDDSDSDDSDSDNE